MAGKRTSNERVLDRLLQHQVNLHRLGGPTRDRVHELLDRTEAQVAADIRRMLTGVATPIGADLRDSFKMQRLVALEASIQAVRSDAWDAVDAFLSGQMADLMAHEVRFAADALESETPIVLDLVVPEVKDMASIVDNEMMLGSTLSEWVDRLADGEADAIDSAIRVGLVRGLSADDIARQVVGSASLNGTDGVTQRTRAQTDALVRTSINHYSNSAKQELYEANRDVIAAEVWHSTLDDRTCVECGDLDGEQFDVGEGEVPPYHFMCRCVRVPTVDGELVGERGADPTTDSELAAQYADENDLGPGINSRDDIPQGHKGSYDDFVRGEMQDRVGPVPAATTFADWLGEQSAAFQDEVLGATKGRLFRDGGLTLDRFVDRRGNEMTLDQLVRKERAAFTRAGLDPADFRRAQ